MSEKNAVKGKRLTVNECESGFHLRRGYGGQVSRDSVNREPCTVNRIDTSWDDTEIVLSKMTQDTKFLFDRMTEATIDAVDAGQGEEIIDLACGRATDALKLAMKGANVFGLDPSDKMLAKAFDWIEPGKNHPVILIRAVAEKIPFPDNSFDKLVCKGSIDHFADLDSALLEMRRILNPGGKLIVSVANFESLSCILGRIFDRAYKKIKGKKRTEHPSWLPPDDHNFKFDYQFLLKKLKPHFEIDTIQGLSLLWCAPYWGAGLEKLSPEVAEKILKTLDKLAKFLPSLSDVLVVRAKPIKPQRHEDSNEI